MAKISDEAKKIIGEVRVAHVATASKSGRPNVSTRGSIRVLDDEHVTFTDRARLYTLANLRENPQVCAVIFDSATRKGCRLWGKAEILNSGELFEKISADSIARGRTPAPFVIKVAVEEEVTF